jgi:hypothetical protein
MAPDKGDNVSVTVDNGARILRVEPGQTDLKTAAPLQLADLQVGDRVLVRGKLSDDSKSMAANSVIAMKHEDLAAKQQKDREDWQRRGIGGLVTSVDAAGGSMAISAAAAGGAKTVTTIHVTKETILRRYAPNSVKFDDATPNLIDQIRPGDQVRARGTRSADGSEFSAEEIVSGAFRNISGTINSVDTAGHALVVTDLVTKKPVTVNITDQSQVIKLPAQVAQGLAVRLKGAAAAGRGGDAAGNAGPRGGGQAAAGQRGGGAGAGRGGQGGGQGGGDLQQIISRMPAAPLTDFQKGDAVMIVSTEGTASGGVTAITMVGGVEPILTASPNGQEVLSPWNIGGGGGGEAGGGGQ